MTEVDRQSLNLQEKPGLQAGTILYWLVKGEEEEETERIKEREREAKMQT